MKYTDVIGGVLGAALGAVLTIAAWLLWPLPDPRFDWQPAAAQYQSEDDCGDLGIFLTDMATADPDGVEAFLREGSIEERCPTINNNSTGLGERRSQVLVDQIERTINSVRGPARFKSDYWRAIQEAYLFWQYGLDVRHESGLGYFAFPELVMAFRCTRPLLDGVWSNWYQARRAPLWSYREATPIPSWEHRYSWCHSLAMRYAANPGGTSIDGRKVPVSRQATELAEMYALHVDLFAPPRPLSH